jgi:hypothetical protein
VREVSLVGWYTGYIAMAIVIALVVALVAAMLFFARRIGVHTRALTEQLDDIRVRTLALGEVGAVADGIGQATEALARLRQRRGRR